jgi:Putative zinc-finger/FecR protein
MFQRHVSGKLAALIDGALDPREAARLNAHLAGCNRCRAARDDFQFAVAMMKRLALVPAPASIWTSIEFVLDRPAVAVVPPKPAFSFWNTRFALLATAVAAVAVAATLWQITRRPSSWDVVRLDAPGGAVRMAIGEWVETGGASTARIRIGEIGTVDVAPNTRMQVLVARANEHRLNLAHGTISAQIAAPPRLFFVETPASTVVDLGCAYTMQVDQDGVGLLRVTQGWASLEWDKLESLVPAGASAPTRPQVGPGTPSFDDATEGLRTALIAFDFEGGGAAAVDTVLGESRSRDTLTLWHLLSRVDPADRVRVFERMVQFAPLPAAVTREPALALDPETLKRWREELAWTW